MKIYTKIGNDRSLPYHIDIDGLKGIGSSPASAVIAALRVGGKIPRQLKNKDKVRQYILDTYPIDRDWVYITQILEENKF